MVDPVLMAVPVYAGEGTLRGCLASDLVLLGCQLLAPLSIGFLDLGHSSPLKVTLSRKLELAKPTERLEISWYIKYLLGTIVFSKCVVKIFRFEFGILNSLWPVLCLGCSRTYTVGRGPC